MDKRLTYIKQTMLAEIMRAYTHYQKKLVKKNTAKNIETLGFIKGLEYSKALFELLLNDIEQEEAFFKDTRLAAEEKSCTQDKK